jgi:uncharacterized repeat protein (TIGR03803 family)
MKTRIKNLFLLPAAMAGLCLLPAGRVTAQTYTALHSFASVSFAATNIDGNEINADGDNPRDGVILAGTTLYGTAFGGGSNGAGTVFAASLDGSPIRILHSFTAPDPASNTNSDGASPYDLVLADGTLYGTTDVGGSYGAGTVFSINTNGDNFTNLYSFTATNDGANPEAGLVLAGDMLYGTTGFSGAGGAGTLFGISTNGFTNGVLTPVYSFTGSNDGSQPAGTLIVSGTTLYGTASGGGDNAAGTGTVFAVQTDGGFTTLHAFPPMDPDTGTNSDGALPYGQLVLSGNILYGTASQGGSNGNGTVFAINISNLDFTVLHTFSVDNITNRDGALPFGGLILSGTTLYGTASGGGSSASGTIFSLDTGTLDFTPLYEFVDFPYGDDPLGLLTLSDNTLYGTTRLGGENGTGTVFRFVLGGGGGGGPPANGLVLLTNGDGTISHGAWPKSLVNGKTYVVTAEAKSKNVFSDWVASGSQVFVYDKATLPFEMSSGLVLQANFVTNVFLAAEGTYRGLFAPTNSARQQTDSGSFLFNLTSTGAVSGTLDLGGQTVSFSGKFDSSGLADITSKATRSEPLLTITLQLDFANQLVNGTISDGAFAAALNGFRDVFSNSDKATAFEGQYTLAIPGTTNPATGPFGTSYGTVKVSSSGAITLAGSLADGTAISQSSVVSQNGYWPLYVSLYGGKGSLWGTNLFANQTLTNASALSWINATNSAKTAVYRSGFTNQQATLTGGIYTPGQALPGNLVVTLQETNPPFTITVSNLSGNTNKLTLKTNKTTGVISGSFAYPGSSKPAIKVNGVIVQGQTNAQGYFLGTNQSGTFILAP